MTWTKSERESLSAMIEAAVLKGNIPITKVLNELHQTIHGTEAEPENGLAKRTTRVENFQKTILYVFTVLTAINAAATVVILLIHKGVIKIL